MSWITPKKSLLYLNLSFTMSYKGAKYESNDHNLGCVCTWLACTPLKWVRNTVCVCVWEREGERKNLVCLQGVHRIKLLLCVKYAQMQMLILIGVILFLLHELIYQLPGYSPSHIVYLFVLFHLTRLCTSLSCSDGSLLI